jgi:hypothetical protein
VLGLRFKSLVTVLGMRFEFMVILLGLRSLCQV